MADLIPFPATRPAPDKVAHVVSRSYEDYSRKERKAIMAHNPFSFLHIIRPGFKFHREFSGARRFEMVRNRYLEFLEEGILIRDREPAFYLYHTRSGDASAYGVFCAASTEDYRNNLIKRHEDTLLRREELFADYLEKVRFNAEPVLIAYPDQQALGALFEEIMQEAPEYFFTTPDRVTHRLWVIRQQGRIGAIREAFGTMESLYIADGHHRCASSELLARRAQTRPDGTLQGKAFRYFMAYLIPESQLRIGSFYRLLTTLNGLSKHELLVRLDQYFRIHEMGPAHFEPTEKHQFSMYLEGEFFALYLRKQPLASKDPLGQLDSQVLYETVLKPVFGVADPRTDPRVRYLHDRHGGAEMRRLIDRGACAVGFGMTPVTMEELKAIANAGQTMPPKSTFIEPKLPSGLTLYDFQNHHP
jgi:uncharacterized protein (DUF1015 family)